MRAEDLTARARIRDAAMEQFAERGIRGTTIRSVAEAAGVSPGLVQHHFGSKEELRRACDTYAIEAAKSIKEQLINEGGLGSPGLLGLAVQTSTLLQRYLARSMVDGSEQANGLFDDFVEYTESVLSSGGLKGVRPPVTSDLHAYAATMVAMHLGVVVLRDHLSRALGVDVLSPEGYPRLATAMLDLYTGSSFDPELVKAMREATTPAALTRPPGPGTPRLRLPETPGAPAADRAHTARPPHTESSDADKESDDG